MKHKAGSTQNPQLNTVKGAFVVVQGKVRGPKEPSKNNFPLLLALSCVFCVAATVT